MAPIYSSAFMAPAGDLDASMVAALQGFANAAIGIFAVGTPPFETTIRPVIYSRTRHQRGQSPFTFNLSGATVKVQPTWLRSRATAP
jgi:hypothetical protein